jgi:hypothetical protein
MGQSSANVLSNLLSHCVYDLIFVITAVAFNLLISGVYIAQKQERGRLVRILGAIMISLAFPLVIVFIDYFIEGRAVWIMVYMGFIFAYMFVELLLDFILKMEFRTKPLIHVPYIVLFYIACFGFIGISFSIDAVWGYVVSVSFWILLACLIYLFWGGKKKRANT